MSKGELQKLDQEDLDELVHEHKATEAASINNCGKEAQIEYLLCCSGTPALRERSLFEYELVRVRDDT